LTETLAELPVLLRCYCKVKMAISNYCLPCQKVWKDGEVKGLVARGGFVVDIKWKNSIPQKVVIKANVKTSALSVRLLPLKVDGLTQKSTKQGGSYVLEFNAEQGNVYELSPI